MRNWKAMNAALGLQIPEEAIERIAEPLDQLERKFRPLIAAIPLETDPACVNTVAQGFEHDD